MRLIDLEKLFLSGNYSARTRDTHDLYAPALQEKLCAKGTHPAKGIFFKS
jgi:hypothetical protein